MVIISKIFQNISHFLDKPGTISGWMKNEIRDRKAKTPVVMWNPLKISA